MTFVPRKTPRLTALAALTALALTACGGKDDAAATSATPAAEDAAIAPAASATPTLADGLDVCFRAIAGHLPATTPVSEVMSSFVAGDDAAQSPLQLCTVDYQSPDDPRKLVGIRLDPATGTFSEPYAIELSVSGNAAEFKLEDYVIPLSQVDASKLAAVVESLKPALDGVYSRYTWTGVRLESPGAFHDRHTLRLDIEGRLASNDLKNSGYASVSLEDGTVVTNHLLP